MIQLTLTQAGWCFLYRLYDMGKRKMAPATKRKSVYGYVDTAGAYHVCLAEGHEGAYKISRDYEASPVYPERVFVWAQDGHGKELTPAACMKAMIKLGLGSAERWERVNVHRGYAQGKTLWYKAWRERADFGHSWYSCREKLAKAGADVYYPIPRSALVTIEKCLKH